MAREERALAVIARTTHERRGIRREPEQPHGERVRGVHHLPARWRSARGLDATVRARTVEMHVQERAALARVERP